MKRRASATPAYAPVALPFKPLGLRAAFGRRLRAHPRLACATPAARSPRPNSPSTQHASRGFTLIEVLVVVAMIALLVAILLPSLSKARRNAEAAACLSNVRMLSMAVLMYAQDNREHLVTVGFAHGGGVDEGAAWFNTLRRSYRSELVARCPADRSPHWSQPPAGSTMPRKVSFGTNWYTVAEVGGKGPYDRLGKFKRPATSIYIAEMAETGSYAASDHYHPEQWFSNPRRLAGDQLALDRHAGRANYSFLDGHAESLVFERTYAIDLERSNFPLIAWRHNLYDPAIAN